MANRSLTANREIRDLMDSHSVRLWQIADIVGKSENTIARKLRHELTDTEKEQYRKIINQIIKGETV